MGQTVDISQSAINSQSSGGGSRLVASLLNVNLKTVAANPLTWASGKSAANTANPQLVVEYVSGTYVFGGATEVPASAVFTVSSFPIVGTTISVKLDAVEQFTFVAGVYARTNDFLADLYTNFIGFGYSDFGYSDPNGYPIPPTGTGASYNGKIISITSNAGATNYLSSSTAFSGGVNGAPYTDFALELNGNEFSDLAANTLVGLVSGSFAAAEGAEIAIMTPLNGSSQQVYSTSGDWAVPVTVGAQDDFVVNFRIYADTIE